MNKKDSIKSIFLLLYIYNTFLLTNLDTNVPTITINSGTYDFWNNNLLYNVEFGLSSGIVTCKNNTRSNATVTTYSSIQTLGVNSITCTATSNSNIIASSTNNIIINSTVPLSNIYGLGNANKNEEYLIIGNGGVQYGPYYQANKGCYYVTYNGENLNTYINGYQASENETNYGNHLYNLKYLNYISTDANYFVHLDENTKYNGLETVLYNNGDELIKIKKITISYFGENCP